VEVAVSARGKTANAAERAVASDIAQVRSLYTGEVLRELGLCPLVVVRTYGAGVHVGWLARYVGQEAELLEGRRLWRWYGANTLHEVASRGIDENARLSQPLPHLALSSVIEILPVSDQAAPSLTRSRWL
jgi:hypothetical protein